MGRIDFIGQHPVWDDGGWRFGLGTVFAVNTDGKGFTNLHSFAYNDGARPRAGLILSGNTLYGTTYRWRHVRQWDSVCRQHQWHGFYEAA